jgi:hypothetical protein
MFQNQQLNPRVRATPMRETSKNPKYFPTYLISVSISRRSSKDPKDGKM